MRYLILGTLALACAAAASLPAHALVMPPCDKPIAQLTLEQIDNCKMMEDTIRDLSRIADEANDGCGGIATITIRRPGREPEIVKRGSSKCK